MPLEPIESDVSDAMNLNVTAAEPVEQPPLLEAESAAGSSIFYF